MPCPRHTLWRTVVAVDDHFFRRYRALLDAEDCAFDELEHAYEDGDRSCVRVRSRRVAVGGRAAASRSSR